MRNNQLIVCLAFLVFSAISVAQTQFVNPQSFSSSVALTQAVAVSNGGGGAGYKDLVGWGRDGLRYFVNPKNNQQIDRFVDDSKRAFPNRLLVPSTLLGFTDLDAGDVNGDGLDDLLVQSYDYAQTPLQSVVQVILYDPATNSYPQAIVVDAAPSIGTGAALMDINSDGLTDVLVSRLSNPTTIELLGVTQVSPGVFSAPSVIRVFTSPPPGLNLTPTLGIAVGDLDGDLDQDIAVSVVSGIPTLVVMEQYVLTQQPGAVYSTTLVQSVPGDRSPDVVIADVDTDGQMDLVYLLQNSSSVQVSASLNRGTTWSSQQLTAQFIYTFGSSQGQRLQTFDWQSDGRDDLLISGLQTGIANSPLRFFTQSATGVFVDDTSQYIGSVVPSRIFFSSGALVSDFDEDGHFDILVNASTSPALLMGSSSGLRDQTFSHGIEYRGQWSNSTYNTGGRCVGDFNGDQFLDLVTVDSGSSLVLHQGDGTGNFLQSSTIYSSPFGPVGDQCVSFDADLDGDLDIFVNGSVQNIILQNTGAAAFVRVNVGGPAILFNSIIEAEDVNGDNRSDIIALGNRNSSPTSDFVLLNLVSGFVSVALPKLPTDRLTSVEFGDFDGDLDVDLAVLSQPSGGVATSSLLVFANGGGSSPTFTRLQVLQNVSAIGSADLNNDSRPDLIAASSTAGGSVTAIVLYNLGGGGFSTSQIAIQATGVTQDVATGDFNNDGFSDFILSVQPPLAFDSGKLSLMTNNQSGGFVESDSGVDINFAMRPIVADPDNDGDLDVFYSALSDQSSLRLILNQDIQLIASRRTSVVTPTPFTLEITSAVPGTSVGLMFSLAPLSTGTVTRFGLLRLTNPVFGPVLPVPAGGTLYYPINLGSAPGFVGQTISVQAAFVDLAGNIQLSNPQSVLLTD